MRDPLAADDELVVDGIPERIAHAAVMACHADTVLHRLGEVLRVLALDLAHRVDRNDEGQVVNRRVAEHGGVGLHADAEPVLVQPAAIDGCALLRIVTVPPAPYNQCAAHTQAPQRKTAARLPKSVANAT